MNNIIKKLCNRETIIYIIFGVLTTAIDFTAFGIIHYVIKIKAITSNTIAWVIAVNFAFITNKLFVFNSKSFKKDILLKEFTTFLSSRLFTLLLTDLFLVIAEHILINMMLAKALMSVVVIILNYILSKMIVFKQKKPSEDNKNE